MKGSFHTSMEKQAGSAKGLCVGFEPVENGSLNRGVASATVFTKYALDFHGVIDEPSH